MPRLADLISENEREKLSREMTHTGRYDNEAIRKERWGQVKSAPGQYAQGVFTDFVGAPVDIANIALTPFGLGSEKPVMGSRHLADLIGADESALPYQVAQYMPLDAGDVVMSAKLWGPALAAALGGTAIAAKASKGAKLSDLAQAMPKQRGIFAGVGAKTADKKALALAEQLKAKGVPDELIWKKTGWTLDTPDKMPRFEIPDNAADFGGLGFKKLQKGTDSLPLNSVGDEQVFSHPEFANTYPDMHKNIDVSLWNDPSKGGHFMGSDSYGQIRLNTGNQTREDMTSTGIHELQHAIQQREGFARGGSPEMFTQADEARVAADALSWKRELLSKRAAMPNADWSAVENAVVHDYQKMGAMDMLPSREARELASQPYVLHGEKVAPDDLAEVENLVKMYGLDKRTTPYNPMDAYKRLAGEAEARLTQARMNMTPEQRLAQYPYQPEYFQKETGVPLRDLIVRKDGGTAMSLPKKIKVFHGSGNEFDVFDPSKAKTAQHIYTTDNASDAGQYGKVSQYEASAKNPVDLSGELTGKQFNDLEDAARNAGLIDEYMPFNDWYEQVFQNGQMYQYYGNQSAQNSLMSEMYAKGYDAVKIPDAGFGGAMSSSWVFEDPSILRKVAK